MYKGFYNLTSSMLTHQRNLDVVGNNLVNISTAGFKQSRYTATTFDDVIYNKVGNRQKIYQEIGRQSYIRANSDIYGVGYLLDTDMKTSNNKQVTRYTPRPKAGTRESVEDQLPNDTH